MPAAVLPTPQSFYTLQVQAEPEVLEQIPADKRDALLGVLRSDPRPSYQHDPDACTV